MQINPRAQVRGALESVISDKILVDSLGTSGLFADIFVVGSDKHIALKSQFYYLLP
jgi:hypothetical protein